ncbi:toll/interleukin-1 receptor domain-containing protein [Geomesophilobacter sediminis]|uniref:Toll/interleukin-1 receptor domain-containing protein n=1 Tax=Geomesophilobacter sediminis TaxID=2798584 RepID=A0A8J7JD46_9BACT|nr:toll/interleukin-1 receptor domain-containing protein [Geomesophilobacter sediminis]MBJ6724943.1 toll/interleukin-1 receptor domain-containing protein [Geomesophilobacter sediminis]
MKIFISHITEEKALAMTLKDWIESTFTGNCEVFVSSDSKSIQLGDRWLDKITESLVGAQLLFILCSPSSVARPWINFEAGCGWVKGIPVIPICHSTLLVQNLPVPLSALQAIGLEDAKFCERLVERIAGMLALPRTPRVHPDMIDDLLRALGEIETKTERHSAPQPSIGLLDENDIKNSLTSWFNELKHEERLKAVTFAAVDAQLNIPTGSTKTYLKDIVTSRWSYKVVNEGANTILFQDGEPFILSAPRRSKWDSFI